MRYVVASLMGVGGILLSFGAVIFVLEIFARQADSARGLREMTGTGTGAVVIGAGLLAVGFLLGRFSRGRARSVTE